MVSQQLTFYQSGRCATFTKEIQVTLEMISKLKLREVFYGKNA